MICDVIIISHVTSNITVYPHAKFGLCKITETLGMKRNTYRVATTRSAKSEGFSSGRHDPMRTERVKCQNSYVKYEHFYNL